MARKKRRLPALRTEAAEQSWSVEWSLVDREGPFPWPQGTDPAYAILAVVLARLNELPFGDLGSRSRSSTSSAAHMLTDLSPTARCRWEQLFEQHGFDRDPYGSVDPFTISYCLESQDSRRIVGAFDARSRTFYPLWWDPRHEVSGNDGRGEQRADCRNAACVHPADEAWTANLWGDPRYR